MPQCQVSDQPDERSSQKSDIWKDRRTEKQNQIQNISQGFAYLLLRNFLKANKYNTQNPLKIPFVMLETVVTRCSKNKIHKMFQTEQDMSIRHEQAYN